jgi:ribosome-associated protein
MKPWHVEGYEARRWILLDYVDFVVHVFHTKAREYYLLDKLWGDARRELVAD